MCNLSPSSGSTRFVVGMALFVGLEAATERYFGESFETETRGVSSSHRAFFGFVAQSVERGDGSRRVGGSIPSFPVARCGHFNMRHSILLCGLLATALTPCLGALFASSSPVAQSPPRPNFSAFAKHDFQLETLDERRPWLNPARAALKA